MRFRGNWDERCLLCSPPGNYCGFFTRTMDPGNSPCSGPTGGLVSFKEAKGGVQSSAGALCMKNDGAFVMGLHMVWQADAGLLQHCPVQPGWLVQAPPCSWCSCSPLSHTSCHGSPGAPAPKPCVCQSSCVCAYELSFHLRKELFLAGPNQVSALALSVAFKKRAPAFTECLQELGRVLSFKFSREFIQCATERWRLFWAPHT